MAKDYQALYDADLALIADAKANGFMDAKAIRDGLGYDKPGPTGRYYSSIETADNYIRRAGEEFVILIPDGEMYYLDPAERVTISEGTAHWCLSRRVRKIASQRAYKDD